jgi:hypothetical protein
MAPRKITGALTFQVHEGPSPGAPSPIVKAAAEAYEGGMRTIGEPRTDIVTLLASTSGLRDAIILREILGPPRGLRALKFIGT